MENNLQIFNNSEFGELGVLMIDGKPYFPATACAKILGYAKPHNAINRHCRNSVKRGVPHPQSQGKTIDVNFIPEGDLYSLITQSKLPAAERFEQWVFNELMPFIREHYNTVDNAENLETSRDCSTDSSLQIFNYNNNEVRTVLIDGEPWWVLKDVCDVLELTSPNKVAGRLDDDEKGRSSIPTLGGSQELTIINESGLYNVIIRSDKPEARNFRRWITHEVLPSIRKHYNATNSAKSLDISRDISTDTRLQIFNNSEFGELGVLMIEDKPYFPATECARLLGYRDATNAIKQHCRWVVKHHLPHPQSQTKTIEVNFISEGDLYRLITRSTLPAAEKFELWVFDEVLPSIRKHGAYMTAATFAELTKDPKSWIKLLTALDEEMDAHAETRAAKEQLQLEAEANAPKVVFADAVTDSECMILIGELAKILKGNGIEIGQNRLFAQLREDGYLIKRKGLDYNMPTQMAMELGLFMIEEKVLYQRGGLVVKTVRVTGKGQQYFVNRFLSEARAAARSVVYGSDVSYQFEQRSRSTATTL